MEHRPLVMHLVHRFAVGGLENGIVNLVNRLPAERWRFAVVSLTDIDGTFARRLQRADVECIALHKPPGQGARVYPRFHRLLRQLRPSVLHTRNLGTLEFQSVAWAAGVPGRVHGEHGRDADDVDGSNRRHVLLRRCYRPFVQQYIALSSELAHYLRSQVGVAPARLHTICNGVDAQRFVPARPRAPIDGCPFQEPGLWLAGTVGRMHGVKAQTLLAEAFIALLSQQPALRSRLRLVMVGDGPLRAECQARLQQAGLSDLAWLPGERSDVPAILRGLDAFVLPSMIEGISNTILEAMACGLPVAATAVGGNPDLVADGVTGALLPSGNAAVLATTLGRWAGDPLAAACLGRAGRLAVEQRFGLTAMVSAYERIYEGLLPPPQPGPPAADPPTGRGPRNGVAGRP